MTYFLVIGIGVLSLKSQDLTSIQIASPNAANLGRYIDYPVNYHTGVPDISIPIYTITEGSLTLPITLSHHAGGLKVHEPASWVGTNWSLNAGGMITRSPQGLLDERKYSSNNINNKSYLRDNGYHSYYTTPSQGGDVILNWDAFANGQLDGEPDLFFFNFAGYSGKFFVREDHTVVTIPRQDVKIKPLFCDNPSSQNCHETNQYIRGWIVTTPDGAKYYFGIPEGTIQGSEAMEYARPSIGGNTQPAYSASSWFLYKIESADNEFKIELQYIKEEYSYFSLSMGGPRPISSSDPYGTAGCILIKNNMEGVRLSKILFSNGQNWVDFLPSSSPRQDLSNHTGGFYDGVNTQAYSLGAIEIRGATSLLCKKFVFSYGYFNDQTTPLPPISQCNISVSSDRKRLKLNSIQEQSCSGTVTTPAWQFTYYDENLVPRRLNYGIDHWGYYNGATSNTGFVPPISINNGNTYNYGTGANRESSWPQMRYGALSTIKYPTGGISEFEYGYDIITTNVTTTQYSNYTLLTTKDCFCHFSAPYSSVNCPTSGYSYEFTGPGRFKFALSSINGGNATFLLYNKTTNQLIKDWTTAIVSLDSIDLAAGNYGIKSYSSSGTAAGQGGGLQLYKATPYTIVTPKTNVVGGLRIDKIKHQESANQPLLSTSFDYLGSVVLFSIPEYVRIFQSESIRELQNNGGNWPQYNSNGCVTVNGTNQTLIGTSSVVPMRTTQGAHKGYEFVKVYQQGNGYTQYQFDITGQQALPGGLAKVKVDATSCPSAYQDYPEPPLPNDFRRGSLLRQTEYDEANRILRDANYNPQYVEDTYGAFGMRVYLFVWGSMNNMPLGVHAPRAYVLRSGRKSTETITEKLYTPGSTTFSATTTVVQYGGQTTMPIMKSIYSGITATGTPLSSVKYSYVPDLTPCNQNCTQYETELQSDMSQAYTNYMYNKALTCNTSSGQNANCGTLKGCKPMYDACNPGTVYPNACYICSYTNYLVELNQAYAAYIQKVIANCSESKQQLCLTNSYQTSTIELDDVITLQILNKISTPLEVIQFKNGKIVESGYTAFGKDLSNSSSKIVPLKKVAFNPVYPVAQSAFSPIQLWNTGQGTTLKIDDGYNTFNDQEYKFDKGHVVEVKSRDGTITSYIWGYNNSVPIVKAVGVSYNLLNVAYNNVSGNLGQIRSQPTLANAMVSTYVYDPLMGITSMVDENGQSTNYDYDNLGRLIKITDHNGKVLKSFKYNYKNP